MNFTEKVNQLSGIIDEQLLPVINKNGKIDECVYFDLPYHVNIGDTLIWHGTEHFLKRTGIKCLYKASCSTFSKKTMKKITRWREHSSCKKILILLQGGGNFGDLYKSYHDFRKEIIRDYPDNPIIILPQTLFYKDESKIKADVELFEKHKNLTICARDKKSYQIFKDNFKNEIIQVPDMAFCIPSDELKKNRSKQEARGLFLRRSDQEFNNIDYSEFIVEPNVDIRDWPTVEKMNTNRFLTLWLGRASRRIPVLFSKLTDIYAINFLKTCMIKSGVKFVSRYNKIYTTRLHVAILCTLLEKPYVFFDNSYGKNSTFFETWLNDLEEVKFIKAS